VISATPAEQILIDLGITRPSEIDLEAIAWTQGAVVKYRPMDRCEATIVGSGNAAVITINARSIAVRQRFSLAHELGHWRHHKGRILFCGAKDIGNPEQGIVNVESQADDFASDLILPSYLFRPIIGKLKKVTLGAVRDLRDEFRASLTATLIKLVDSNRFPILIVCHGQDRRRWFRRAAMIPQWWFPRADLDPDSFAFDMLFKRSSESSHPRKMGAGAWFDFRNCERYEVQEQSFMLPDAQTLTLLTIPEDGIQ